MDAELTLHELRRLEAERKLRSIPEDVLDIAWVRDAQVEAVIDSVLAVHYVEDDVGYARARHVGEWCARIAAGLPLNLDPVDARRIGALFRVATKALVRIPELRHLVPQMYAHRRVVAVAWEFESRLAFDSPHNVVSAMRQRGR